MVVGPLDPDLKNLRIVADLGTNQNEAGRKVLPRLLHGLGQQFRADILRAGPASNHVVVGLVQRVVVDHPHGGQLAGHGLTVSGLPFRYRLVAADLSFMEWMLRLPMTTPMSLNHRQHHMVKAKKVREVRDAAALLAKAAKIPACRKVRVTLIYAPRDARRRDSLNLVPTLKACEDGLVDAGVVPDDTPIYLESTMPLIDAPEKGQPGALHLLVERIL